MNHNNNFNFIRLVAALLVIISHAWKLTGNSETEPLYALSQETLSFAGIGLYMFFFTSGFLVTQSARNSENTIHFLFKRALRIYPALIVLVLVSVFVAGPLLTRLSIGDYYRHANTWRYMGNMLGVGTKLELPGVFDGPKFPLRWFNAPLWSVSLELKLYTVLAILLAVGWIHKKRVHLLTSAGMLLTIYLFLLLHHYGYITIRGDLIRDLEMVITFFLGSLVQTSRLSEKWLGITGIGAGIIYILRFAGVLELMPILDEPLFFSIITYFLAYTNKFTIRLTNDISYGMYLYSWPTQICWFMISGYNTSPWVNILALGPIIGIAWLSWKCIERPSLQFKSYYYKLTAALNL